MLDAKIYVNVPQLIHIRSRGETVEIAHLDYSILISVHIAPLVHVSNCETCRRPKEESSGHTTSNLQLLL